jgi:two-component system sensor histidine kinase AtoS
MERRGLVMAQSLAATSKAAFATYNYIALGQAANQALQDPDTAYVIIHDKEGRVAGYSGRPDLQSTLLDDEVSRGALSAKGSVVRQTNWGEDRTPVLDIAVPVFLPGSDYRWGTVRVALSLLPMHQQVRQAQLIIGAIGLFALVLGTLVAVWAARRVTRPLGHLVQATIEAARGNLDQEIDISTGDEVEVLAQNFLAMIKEVLSQRQQLELQLSEIKRLQHYTEGLLITMSDGLLSVDRHGNVATVNPAAGRMLQVAGKDVLGAPLSQILTGAPALREHIHEMLECPGSGTQLEIRLERDEEPRVILAGSSAIIDAEGKAVEVIVNLHDVTQLKRLEARVRQSDRLAALGTLAAGMAHEIRNPLSAIKTFVQLLPRKLEKPGFLEKFQRTVPRELERINRLIEDLLDLARDPRYHFNAVSLSALLEHSAELFEEEMLVNSIHYRGHIPAGLPRVRADVDQLTKALHNLFRNAIQAMPLGGDLQVEAAAVEDNPLAAGQSSNRKGWIRATFKDTGTGIPPELLKSIFNPFFTTRDKGTGLGLAITHKVIAEHGGHIDVISREDHGTTFTLYLPILDRPSATSPT